MNSVAGNPLVSVIIPVYNNAAYIKDTIESALAQTWKHVEVIVVDDGSTDDSLAIARSFENSGRVAVYARENSGATAARNAGFAQSKGDYIQYLDADDILAPDKIRHQLQMLTSLANDFISSCSWGIFTDDIAGAKFLPEPVWRDADPVDWLVTAWKGGGMMQTACWLTPRHLIEAAGPWDESLKKNPNDDGEFFCRVMLKSQGIKYCNDAVVYYRTHTGPRVSRSTSRTAVESLLATCKSYQQHIFKAEQSPRTAEAVANNYATFIYQFHHLYPDLADEAFRCISKLNLKHQPLAGGNNFKKLSALIGFRNALRMKKWIYNFKEA